MQHLQIAKAGLAARPRIVRVSCGYWISDLRQGNLGYRAALVVPAFRPRTRRAALGLGAHRKLLRLRRDRSFEEFEAELVAAVLVLVHDHAHMAAAFQMPEQH